MTNRPELPDFFIIPTILYHDKTLGPLDHHVYAIVYWYTKLKLEKCFASNQTIAEMLGSSAASVANSVNRLKAGGYIDTTLDERNHRKEIIPLIDYSNNFSLTHRLRGVNLQVKGVNLQVKGGSCLEQPQKKVPNKNSIIRTINNTAASTKTTNGEGKSNTAWLTNMDKDDIIKWTMKFPELPEEIIKREASKAYTWLEERKNGQSKNPNLFLHNWLDRVVDKYKNNYAYTKTTIGFQ